MGLLDWWRHRQGSAPGVVGVPDRRRSTTARLDLGADLLSQGSHAAALSVYEEAIEAGDDPAPSHLGHARACIALARFEEALDSLEVAAALEPDDVETLGLLADVRIKTGSPAEAVIHLRRALDLKPHRADLHFALARALNRAGDCAAAVAAYEQSIRLDPSDPAPRVNLGLIYLQEYGQPQRAEADFRAALAVAPEHLIAIANLGLALHDQGRHAEAQEVYRRGLEIDPDNVELRWNRGIQHLCLGRYAQGWKDYALRFRRAGGRDLSRFDYPDWDAGPLRAGRLLVLAEQGLGDEIRFASCLPDLRARSTGVVLECAPRLAALFGRSFPWAEVRGTERNAAVGWRDSHPDIQAKIPVGELPRLLRPTLDRFPRHGGYLTADPNRVAEFRRRMSDRADVRNVGLSWRGGTRSTRGAIRSIALESMQGLLAVPGVRFVCLQHDLTAAERALARAAGVVLWDEVGVDIDATAALIQALDAVLSVPNTNANLAGALGKRAWVLLNASPDWYWRSVGGGSPWYPSVSLLQVETANEWTGVIDRARSELVDWAHAGPAAWTGS